MATTEPQRYVTAWVPLALADRVRERARTEELSVSWIVRRALREYMARMDESAA